MFNNEMADPTFGIKMQALAILAVLSKQEPTFADYNKELHSYIIDISTYPWFNGREKGVALVIERPTPHSRRALIITFGECRNSDQIFVDSWVVKNAPFNGPTLADFPNSAYEQRQTVGYLDIKGAVNLIKDKAEAFYNDEKARQEREAERNKA